MARVLLGFLLAAVVIGCATAHEGHTGDGECQATAQLATCQGEVSTLKATVEQWQAYSETLKLEIQTKGAEATTCASQLQAAQTAQAQAQQATQTAVAAAKADAGAQVTAAQAQVVSITAQLQQAQAALATAQAELTSSKAALTKTKAELSTAQSELTAAKSQSREAPKLDATQVKEFLVASARGLATSASTEAKLLFEELKQGNCSRLTKLAVQGATIVADTARGIWAFVVKEADEHLPESVKTQAREAHKTVSAAWKKHVLDATWAQGIIAAVATANRELKAVLTTFLKKQPALSHLADPVTVQLIVYGVIGLPLMVLLLLPVLMLLSSPSRPAQGAAEPKGKKKGGKPAGGKGARVKA